MYCKVKSLSCERVVYPSRQTDTIRCIYYIFYSNLCIFHQTIDLHLVDVKGSRLNIVLSPNVAGTTIKKLKVQRISCTVARGENYLLQNFISFTNLVVFLEDLPECLEVERLVVLQQNETEVVFAERDLHLGNVARLDRLLVGRTVQVVEEVVAGVVMVHCSLAADVQHVQFGQVWDLRE